MATNEQDAAQTHAGLVNYIYLRTEQSHLGWINPHAFTVQLQLQVLHLTDAEKHSAAVWEANNMVKNPVNSHYDIEVEHLRMKLMAKEYYLVTMLGEDAIMAATMSELTVLFHLLIATEMVFWWGCDDNWAHAELKEYLLQAYKFCDMEPEDVEGWTLDELRHAMTVTLDLAARTIEAEESEQTGLGEDVDVTMGGQLSLGRFSGMLVKIWTFQQSTEE